MRVPRQLLTSNGDVVTVESRLLEDGTTILSRTASNIPLEWLRPVAEGIVDGDSLERFAALSNGRRFMLAPPPTAGSMLHQGRFLRADIAGERWDIREDLLLAAITAVLESLNSDLVAQRGSRDRIHPYYVGNACSDPT